MVALLDGDLAEIMLGLKSAPLADIGCGDGDFALLFARLGVEVDAIDFAPNNYNRMAGIETLKRLLSVSVNVLSVDLNTANDLPQASYGLALALGLLYHLKNPYGFLERLAYQAPWCLLSTRIAQVTPRSAARVENEPIAYLADGREIGNDATNFWIFSAAGLLRILQRTRWAIVSTRRSGCTVDSNPIDGEADERMSVLLRSRVHFPQLSVRLLDGWHAAEQGYRWTQKRFSVEVVLPLETPLSGFSLFMMIPDALVAGNRAVSLCCTISGHAVGTQCYSAAGVHLFKGDLPPFALHEPILGLSFEVDSAFHSTTDARELGVCVPLTGEGLDRIDFRVF